MDWSGFESGFGVFFRLFVYRVVNIGKLCGYATPREMKSKKEMQNNIHET